MKKKKMKHSARSERRPSIKEAMSRSSAPVSDTVARVCTSVDKGTITTFSDMELLRKVQFPVVPSRSGTPRTMTGLSAELRLAVEWDNISCTGPLQRGLLDRVSCTRTVQPQCNTILKDICGSAFPGDFLAILGPPNCGKSSLLNVLSGYWIKGFSGDVLVNNEKINGDKISRHSSYVPQADVHLGCFSVKETLWLAAELKYPTSTERRDKFNAVVNAMETWCLQDAGRTLVRDISKTECRLLTCAQQSMCPRSIIFVDDPTRYLDESQVRACMTTLNYFALQGHTVVAAISNPTSSMMNYFTKICVLSEGRSIYYGVAKNIDVVLHARGFTRPSDTCIIDFLLEVACGMHGDLQAFVDTESKKIKALLEATKVHRARYVTLREETTTVPSEDTTGEVTRRRRPSMANIFRDRAEVDARDYLSVLFNRFIFLTFRSPVHMTYRQCLNIGTTIVFANVWNSPKCGVACVDMNVSFLFLYVAFMSMWALFSATLKSPLLVQHVIREQWHSLYTKKAYFFARIFSELAYEFQIW
ncbi:uncharacterized protein LOC135383889 isoform X2 [Ornithodoros turicata]|uniref:uncharacterized protein LOC135383889 isoform X2 n=1 Tax=Ornithodoros turicata TaxID=34597 RepID=UPI00313A3770